MNQWTHVALTFGGGSVKLYINGALPAPSPRLSVRSTSRPRRFPHGDRVVPRPRRLGQLFHRSSRRHPVLQRHADRGRSRQGRKPRRQVIGQFFTTTPTTFDGSTTMLQSGVHNGLVGTIEAWINPTPPTRSAITNRSSTPTTSGAARERHRHRPERRSNQSPPRRQRHLVDRRSVTLNTWTHVAFSFTGTTAKLYVNGVLRGTRSYTANASSLAGKNYRIGWGQTGINDNIVRTFFDGEIYGLKFYDKAIAPTPLAGQLFAVNDTVDVVANSGANTLTVLSNDYDTGFIVPIITVYSVTQGVHGTVAKSADSLAVLYTPATGYLGPDFFTYTITDGYGNYSTATVSVSVNQASGLPVGSANNDVGGPASSGSVNQTAGSWTIRVRRLRHQRGLRSIQLHPL